MLEGVVGQFLAALSITLTIAVLISLILAVTIIPLLAEAFLVAEPEAEKAKEKGIMAAIGRGIDAMSDKYQRSLDRALHHTRLMIVGAVVLIVAGVVAYKYVPTGF